MWVSPFKKEFSKLCKTITCKALRITEERDCPSSLSPSCEFKGENGNVGRFIGWKGGCGDLRKELKFLCICITDSDAGWCWRALLKLGKE